MLVKVTGDMTSVQLFERKFKETSAGERYDFGSKVEVFAERRVWVGRVTGIVTDSSNELFYRVHFDGTHSNDDLRVSYVIALLPFSEIGNC